MQIARVADKPELLSRIEREINDNFSECRTSAAQHLPKPENTPLPSIKSGTDSVQVYQAPKGVNLALLAKGNDLSKYIKARQKAVLAKEQKNEIE